MEALGHGDMTNSNDWKKSDLLLTQVEGRRMHYEHTQHARDRGKCLSWTKQMKIKTTPSTSPHEASIKKKDHARSQM